MTRTSSNTNRFRTVRTALVMALGALALLALPGLASAKDRNRDRIPDRWEKAHHLSLKVKQTKRDQDRDGLKNLGEFQNGTNPRDADTDNDGLDDGTEVEVGDDPADNDSDDDGVVDGDENAGKVATFDGTTLTIDLAGGGSISGLVTDQTEIECDTEDHHGDDTGDHHGGDRTNPAQEGGSGSPGDDNEGSENPGEDEGSENPGDDENESSCSVDDLVPGAVVHEAEIHVSADGAVFEKVELEPAAAPAAP